MKYYGYRYKVVHFGVLVMAAFLFSIMMNDREAGSKKTACSYEWEDTGFRVPVERLSDEEANAYYDGRKLVNDNQRNYIDNLAEGDK